MRADGAGARPVTFQPGGEPDWRLAAIVTHAGARGAGHYVAYVARGEIWRRCDDATVARAGVRCVKAQRGERVALALFCRGLDEHAT